MVQEEKDIEIGNDFHHAEIGNEFNHTSPKDWFQNVLLKGLPIMWGTNTFSDTAVLDILEKYKKYLDSRVETH